MQVGRIVSVQVSRHARTLDKYMIVFGDESVAAFWDIQLEDPPEARRAS
jgi:hypothetical protein